LSGRRGVLATAGQQHDEPGQDCNVYTVGQTAGVYWFVMRRPAKVIVTPPNLVRRRRRPYDARIVGPPTKAGREGRVAGKLSLEAQKQT